MFLRFVVSVIVFTLALTLPVHATGKRHHTRPTAHHAVNASPQPVVKQQKEKKPATIFSLPHALSNALDANPAILEAVAKAEAAENRAKVQRAALLPEVRASTGWGVQQEDQFPRVRTRHPFTSELTLSQPLSLTDEAIAWRASKAQAEAARADAQAVIQETLLNTTGAYLDVLVAEDALANTKQLVANLVGQQRGVARLYQEGEGTRTAVAEIGTRLANARSEEQRALANLETARARLGALIPLPAAATLVWPDPVTYKPLGATFNPDKHPRVTEAEAQRHAAEYQRRLSSTNILPEFSLNAATGRSTDDFNGGRGEWANRLTINASYPLFRGGRDMYGINAAVADEDAAEQALARARNDAVAEQSAAFSTWQTSLAALSEARLAETHQQTAIKGARLEFQNGERSITDLLNAEEEYIQTAIALTRARREALFSTTRLRAAEATLTFP